MSANSGTQVISRVCRLLKSFDYSNQELSLAELVKINGLNPTTAYRILQALVDEGFLIQDSETTKYTLGYGLVKLGELAEQGNALLKMARPYAEKLAKYSGESITIEVLNNIFQVEPVLFIPSSYRVSVQPTFGKPLPAHCTATGKAQIAFLPPEQLAMVFDLGLKPLTQNTITDPNALKVYLEKVREQGYATAREELEPDLVAIAAPIFDSRGRVHAGISVGGPSSRLSEERIAEITPNVVKIASEISAELGFRDSIKK
jgi:IclR family transcriptional regulator, KDG regulon repressor